MSSAVLLGLGLAGLLLDCGSAVTGLFISGLLAGRIGRTGAEDKVPVVDIAVAGLEIVGTNFIGVADGSADPGRSGRIFPAIFARFCAAMVSLIEGCGGTELVLREKKCTFVAAADVDGSGSL